MPDLAPVAHDQRLVAVRAKGGVALAVVHIAGVDVVQAQLQGDVPGPHQGGSGCGRNLGHFVVGVKSREVQRHIGSQTPA
jgi:hypothetical protein